MRREDGFTLVELMVAATILLIGLFGAVAMIDRAVSIGGTNSARVGATNLAREILEDARAIDYDQLNPTQLAGALQSRPGLGGSGNPWTLTRRGTDYSVNVTVCTVDDPKDGLATTPPVNACPRANPVASPPEESNPDDFRSIKATVTWTYRGRNHTLTQHSLIVNPAGGLGPRIIDFPQPVGQITSGTEVRWGSGPLGPVTTSGANAVRWAADDAASQGDATGGSTAWTFAWDIGTYGTGTFVVDGAYTVTAQAFDSRGVAGESRLVGVLLNRDVPFAPTGVTGGRNMRFGSNGIVDLSWNANPERDIVGYRVDRLSVTGLSWERVCPATAETQEETTCTDPDPPVAVATYRVLALDREDLAADNSTLRDGVPQMIVIPPAGLTPPAPTAPWTVDTEPTTGLPLLNWTQPAATPPIAFYRIYRDSGTDLEDRYAFTATATPTWTDPDPGTTSHTYWITAVDENFNESEPLGPLTWSGP